MKTRALLTITMVLAVSGQAVAEDEDYRAGKQIFDTLCSDSCHQTPDARQLSAKQWRVVLNTMQKRMEHAGLSPLTDEELQQLLHFLTDGQ